MSKKRNQERSSVTALRVKQWLSDWNSIDWNAAERRSEPKHWFYQFSMPASDLKRLSGIYARTTNRSRSSEDLGIQRRHETKRSEEIKRFVRFGYPWSDLSETKRASDEYRELQQPGWLPTAVVVNILTSNDERNGERVSSEDLVGIEETNGDALTIHYPDSYTGPGWIYQSLPPIEIIDGQHRLWAFEDSDLEGDFELPVIAFHGLDLSWQAYLFYTVNIKPKKINASLAFDLYPLLRTEKWLNKFEGHVIYRETRAQELVDILWSHKESPWFHRINMLGEPGYKGYMATQAAWVRSLLAALIKSWEGPGVRVGGIFGAPVGSNNTVLPWGRPEQAAFVIAAGRYLRDEIAASNKEWAESLRKHEPELDLFQETDTAFVSKNSLLNQDQGIRTFLHILNDITFVLADDLQLDKWGGQTHVEDADEAQVTESLEDLYKDGPISGHLSRLAGALSQFDWRASSAPGLDEQKKVVKASYRGSGGYKELRRHVLKHLAKNASEDIAHAATSTIDALGYE